MSAGDLSTGGESPGPAPRGRPIAVFAAATVATFLLDQLTKSWAAGSLQLGRSTSILGEVVRLTSVRNEGAAFGLLPGNLPLLVVASVVALGVVGYALVVLPPERLRERIALGLVAGGAAGNLLDRLRCGSVVDFLDVGWGEVYRWPTFNLADAAVTIGVALLLWWAARSERMRKRAPEAHA